MKKYPTLFALIALLTACQDDTKQLLRTIDGRWQVNTVTYTSQSGRDSTATLKAVSLNFDRCSKSDNQSGPSNCPLEYIADNQPFRFAYQAPDGGKSLYISPTNQMSAPVYKQVADRLAGSYEVVTLSDNSLIIRRSLQGSLPGFESIQYSATK